MEPQLFDMVMLGRRWLDDDVFELRLARPAQFACIPGQYLRLHHQDRFRDYTVLMEPRDAELALLVRRVPNGALSPYLARIEPGEALLISGPHGYFNFQPSPRAVVMVATGTGIAPVVAMYRNGLRDACLIHGARTPGGLYYARELQQGLRAYVPCLSAPEGALPVDGIRGRVSDYLANGLEPGVYDFYVSGQRRMVRDVMRVIDDRFDGSTLFSENFG